MNIDGSKGQRHLMESYSADINRKKEEDGEVGEPESVSQRERWSSGKRSEPGPLGAATDEVAE